MKELIKKHQTVLLFWKNFIFSSAAIIISFSSLKVACNQYKMEYILNSAKFRVKESSIRNPNSGMIVDHEVSISLTSGYISDFNHHLINILTMKVIDSLGLEKIHDFAFNNFYESSFHINDNDGLLRLIKGFQNWKRYNEFQDNLIMTTKGYRLVLDLKTYIKLNYSDFDGTKKSSYYELSTLDTKPISEEKGEIIFAKHKTLENSDKIIKLYDPEKINYLEIIKMLKE